MKVKAEVRKFITKPDPLLAMTEGWDKNRFDSEIEGLLGVFREYFSGEFTEQSRAGERHFLLSATQRLAAHRAERFPVVREDASARQA